MSTPTAVRLETPEAIAEEALERRRACLEREAHEAERDRDTIQTLLLQAAHERHEVWRAGADPAELGRRADLIRRLFARAAEAELRLVRARLEAEDCRVAATLRARLAY
jgi:hypothetical protein